MKRLCPPIERMGFSQGFMILLPLILFLGQPLAQTSWTCVNQSADWSERDTHGSAVFNDNMWIVKGIANGVVCEDVWYSKDGKDWIQATKNAPFPMRTKFGCLTFAGKIWVLGGYEG